MTNRHGNFPYDFDSKFPDPPAPAIPPNPVHNSSPPPAAAAPVPPSALPAKSDAPLVASLPTLAISSTPEAPEIKKAPRKTLLRKPPRRSGPFKPRSAPSATPAAPPQDESEASRHARKCSVCSHPERDAIDDDFINWIEPSVIAFEFGVSERAIRRRARATGLNELRSRKCLSALGLIIERAMSSKITGDTVIRAIRATSSINESGQWVESPKRVIFSIEHLNAPATRLASAAPALTTGRDNPVLELSLAVSPDGVLIDRHDD